MQVHPPVQRRRAERDDVRQKRAALAVVRPIQSQIGEWHQTLALVGANAQRNNLPQGRKVALRAELALLCETIAQNRDALDRVLAGLPADIRSNSWVTDTVRAIRQVDHGATALARALS